MFSNMTMNRLFCIELPLRIQPPDPCCPRKTQAQFSMHECRSGKVLYRCASMITCPSEIRHTHFSRAPAPASSAPVPAGALLLYVPQGEKKKKSREKKKSRKMQKQQINASFQPFIAPISIYSFCLQLSLLRFRINKLFPGGRYSGAHITSLCLQVSLLRFRINNITNTYSPISLVSISPINLVSIFRCSSSAHNGVHARRVDSSTQVFSLSSYRTPYIVFAFISHFNDS